MQNQSDGMRRMSDAALSAQLGKYQRAATVCLFIGLLGVLGGIAAYFLISHPLAKAICTGVLFFGGICCAIFLGGGARKKMQRLIQEQLGEFFHEELQKTFGAPLHTPQMRIDSARIEAFRLTERQWERCEITDFYEGISDGLHFSAANVILYHAHRVGTPQDGYETREDAVFHGLAVCLQTRDAAHAPLWLHAQKKEDKGGMTQTEELAHRFFAPVESGGGASALLTQKFLRLLGEAEQRIGARTIALRREGRVLSLLMETDYRFAAVPDGVDMRDLEAVRRGYVTSVRTIGQMLEIFGKNEILQRGMPV